MQLFAVITGDVIDSKKHPDSLEILKKNLIKIKQAGLYTPFYTSRGDELQAVCEDFSLLPPIIRNLRYACRPLKLRIGIGIGAIDSNSKRGGNPWDMTGPAFISARRALDSLKLIKDPQTVLTSEDPFFDRVFNSIYLLLDLIVSGWTEPQWQAVQAYEADRTYVKAAGELNVAWQNVQKRCQAAKWDQIRKVEENLAILCAERFRNES